MHWKQGTNLKLHGGQAVHVGQLQQRLHFHGRVLRGTLSPQRRQRVGVHLQQGAATQAGVPGPWRRCACGGWLQLSEGQPRNWALQVRDLAVWMDNYGRPLGAVASTACLWNGSRNAFEVTTLLLTSMLCCQT